MSTRGHATGGGHGVCREFATHGRCKYGDNCHYSHGHAEDMRVELSLNSPALAHQVNVMFHVPSDIGAPKRVTNPTVVDKMDRIVNSEAAKFLVEVMRQLSISQTDFFSTISEVHPAVRAIAKIAKLDNYIATSVPAASTLYLSFQRVFVPLLFVLSHAALEETSMRTKANILLSAVQDEVVTLIVQFITHTVPLLDKGNMDDGTPGVIAQQFAPLSFAQLFGPMAKFLEIIIKRLPNVANRPNVKQGVTTIQQLVDLWATHVKSGTLTTVESQYAVDRVNEIMNRVRTAIDGGLDTMLARAMERASLNTAAATANRARDARLWADDQLEAPTGLHDNDHVAIANIKLIPTHDEVVCTKESPLPGNLQWEPNAHWLPPGPARLLDTHFRLLREDMMSAVKTGIRLFMNYLAEGGQFKESGRFTRNQGGDGTDLAVYTNVVASDIVVSARYGATVPFKFDLPARALGYSTKSGKSKADAKVDANGQMSLDRFWDNCLARDNLVCVCFPESGTYSPVFATIADRDDKVKFSQVAGTGRATVTLSFGIDDIPRGVLQDRSKGRGAKYAPRMFSSSAAGSCLKPPTATQPAPPPKYALTAGFQIDLSFLKKNSTTGPRLTFAPADQTPGVRDALVASLMEHTTLDATQSRALLGALGSEVACVQGPPGTGKSFIGVKIVEALYKLNKKDLFPILCMCYTNHALDDFLESLIDVNIGSLVRIGSLTGSWIDGWLKGLDININRNIIVESLRAPKGGNIFDLLNQVGDDDEGAGELGEENLFALVAEGVDVAEAHAAVNNKGRHAREDVAAVPRLKLSAQATEAQARLHWVESTRPDLPLDELLEVADVWRLKLTERRVLADYMFERARAEYELDVRRTRTEFHRLMGELSDMRAQKDIEAVRNKKVIGLTTTGAAKYQHLIAAVRPKVIICEEAGEILEAHVLAALHPGVQQLIMIGDHKQLRPKTNDFRLDVKSKYGKSYRLNVSLFERLIVSESPQLPPMLPHDMLLAQRRMKPVISQFIKKVYPELEDGAGTQGRPAIKGVAKDVFFLAHSKPQDSSKEDWSGNSHSNTYEANMAVALVEYLLKQGYGHKQIVVLTPYVGQLLKIREIMGRHRLLVEVGELDATAIALATGGDDSGDDEVARPHGRVGARNRFVKDANRTVVALSRARMGMYIIGNADLLAAEKSASPDWIHVISMMREQGLIGEAIEVYCQRHPDYRHQINDPDHLRIVSPDGGCNQSCDFRLDCGHICQRMCHSDDQKHTMYACRKPCTRLHDGCGHPCPKLCNTPCGDCMAIVEPITLPCGHVLEKPWCFQTKSIESIKCHKKVTRLAFAATKSWSSAALIPTRARAQVSAAALLSVVTLVTTTAQPSKGPLPAMQARLYRDGVRPRPMPTQMLRSLYAMYRAVYVVVHPWRRYLSIAVRRAMYPESPIVVLSCGHALTVANCDAMFALESVYRRLGSQWVSVKPFPDDDERLKGVFTCPNVGPQLRATKSADTCVSARGRRRCVSKKAEKFINKAQSFLKSIKSDPSRRVTDACWHAASDAFIRRELEATIFLRNYTVEEGRVYLLAGRAACVVLSGMHERAFAWNGVGGQGRFRIAEARLDRLAVAKSRVELMFQYQRTTAYSGLTLVEKEEHKRQCLKLAKGALKRSELVLAMGAAYGHHWYTCPNGHLYFIGDCGQASKEARVPIVDKIGGSGYHQLREGNQRATNASPKPVR
ncbi:hypothetical protein BCR44DRAFT_1463653 [Catenaria anguillulae PL171]|uniref:Uncharacterized protein n=1 Tax=Catenaria anguillulae PL171 TaxID=765915 RepID=A0A1Y2HAW7_9FUNG|nr:hypothetical protein BCR44DRAFT_1463653 [Catenaria anguillulae PL171]